MSAIDISAQTLSFFYAILLGAVLAFLYDFIKLLHHNLLKSIVAVQLADVLFGALCAAVSFCFFMLVSNGSVRVYLLLGEGIGFLLWSLLCSAYVQKFLLFLVRTGGKIISFVAKPLAFLCAQPQKIIFKIKNRRIQQKTLEKQGADVV